MHSMHDWFPSYFVLLPPLSLCLLHAFNNFFTILGSSVELNKINSSCFSLGDFFEVGLENVELVPVLYYKLKSAELSSE